MRRARGFSLVEVMLSLALLAAGLALAFATLRNATLATERAESTSQRQERLRAVQAFMRRQIDGAMTQPIEYEEATGEAVLFRAEDGGISFVAPMPGYLSRGGPYVQHFRLARGDGGGLQLEFDHQLLTPDGAIDSEREPEVLLTGIADGGFELRAIGDDGEPGDWTRDWDTPEQLPRLVRLQLRMQDGNSPWPTFVAAPRVGAAAAPALAIDADGALPEEEEQ